ncbi:uncharacterized protein LOC143452954 [Clavelina lepadiformis]|uniref:uncharacterized protein LOC143452954 n=1 Tax=Clavelina lepadiformis TaxID=159417 RepID=UPI004040F197
MSKQSTITMAKHFSIEVNSVETSEVYPVHNVSSSTKIIDLKIKLELIAGIPTHLQRIMYLDQGDMEDNSTLRHHDVVSGARLTMHVWNSWSSLLRASVKGNIKDVMALGVTADSDFHNPNTDQMTPAARKEWFLTRSAIALYIAAHRGHTSLMKALIQSGVDVAAETKHGRNALHVAAASGEEQAVDVLLENGAGHLISKEDFLGETPLQTSATWGHKSAERKLFLFQWRKRAGKMKKISLVSSNELMAHQLFDSTSSTWLYGKQSQLYHSNILPPQEFQGTRIDSKRSLISLKSKSHHKIPASREVSKDGDLKTIRPKIVVHDDAILTKGSRKNGEQILTRFSTGQLPDKKVSLDTSFPSKQAGDSCYKERRLTCLEKYIPSDMIVYGDHKLA